MALTHNNFRAMIYYDFRRGLLRQECIDQLISTFGDEAPSYATVKRCYNEFNRDRHSLTYCEIKGTLGISSTSIYKICMNIYP